MPNALFDCAQFMLAIFKFQVKARIARATTLMRVAHDPIAEGLPAKSTRVYCVFFVRNCCTMLFARGTVTRAVEKLFTSTAFFSVSDSQSTLLFLAPSSGGCVFLIAVGDLNLLEHQPGHSRGHWNVP